MFLRNRAKQVMVEYMDILNVSFSAVVQIGDVVTVDPITYEEAYGGYRGAVSFVTTEISEPVYNRLNYANQLDEDLYDTNIYEEDIETFKPNTQGVTAR